jgi:monooxygenase
MSSISGPDTTPSHVDVIVVGAGLTGIDMGYHLKTRQPGKTFALLEASQLRACSRWCL